MDDIATFDYVNTHMLVGEGILVRAVTRAGERSVDTYLPPGEWMDYWNEKAAPLAAGKHTVTCEKGRIPVFVKIGQILVKKMRRRRSTGAQALDPYSIYVYGAKAAGRLYVDDGNTQDYEDGKFIYEQFAFDGITLTERPFSTFLSVGKAKGVTMPERGLVVERIVFLGLAVQPTGALLKHADGKVDTVHVRPEQSSDGKWIATVKKPTGLIGGKWSLELAF